MRIIILPEYDQTPPLYIKALGVAQGVGNSRGTQAWDIAVDPLRNVVISGYRNPAGGANPRYGMVAYYDKDQNIQWVKSFHPGSGASTQYGCAFDSSGNIITVGLRNDGAGRSALLKIDPTGTLIAQRRLKESSTTTAWDVAVDPSSGHIYVGYGGLSRRCIIHKINGSTYGNIWARSIFNGPYAGACTGVAVGTDGSVYACGWSYDNVTSPPPSTSRATAWVARFDSDGNLLWVRGLGNTGDHQWAHGIAVDSENDPVVVGYESDKAPENAFIAKWNSVGGLQWQRRISPGSTTRFYDVAVDADDNFWCAGQTLSGDDNMIHVRIRGTDGESLTNRRFGGDLGGDDRGYGVAVDNKGASYIAGYNGISTFIDVLHNGNEHALWGKFAGDGSDGAVSWQNPNPIQYSGAGLANTAGPLTHYLTPPHNVTSFSMSNVQITPPDTDTFTTSTLTDVTPPQNP